MTCALKRLISFAFILFALAAAGCADDVTDLKHKIAELEKKVSAQQKELAEMGQRVGRPSDFSADIQRIEDQQEGLADVIKTKVDPLNTKMEEFREWAQETQAERGKILERLKALEQSVADTAKQIETESRAAVRLTKELEAEKRKFSAGLKAVEELSRTVAQIKKDVAADNERLLEAVKRTLPKVKSAAVAEIQDRLAPIEKNLSLLKSGADIEKRAVEAAKAQGAEGGKDVTVLRKRVAELEDVLASHKSFLLEVGTKLHELEEAMRGGRAG
jgi:chromosome segregation ATPase